RSLTSRQVRGYRSIVEAARRAPHTRRTLRAEWNITRPGQQVWIDIERLAQRGMHIGEVEIHSQAAESRLCLRFEPVDRGLAGVGNTRHTTRACGYDVGCELHVPIVHIEAVYLGADVTIRQCRLQPQLIVVYDLWRETRLAATIDAAGLVPFSRVGVGKLIGR